MTDGKTFKRRSLESTSLKEVRDGGRAKQIIEKTSQMTEAMKSTADVFNMLRSELARCCDLIKEADASAKEYAKECSAVNKGDFAVLLEDNEDMPPAVTEVEDAASFEEAVSKIVKHPVAESRMRACIRLNNKIREAVERWQSKLDKMRTLSTNRGSSTDEIETVYKKCIQFEEAIKILRKRGSLVSEIFFNTRKKLVCKIERLTEEFDSVNYQEKI